MNKLHDLLSPEVQAGQNVDSSSFSALLPLLDALEIVDEAGRTFLHQVSSTSWLAKVMCNAGASAPENSEIWLNLSSFMYYFIH